MGTIKNIIQVGLALFLLIANVCSAQKCDKIHITQFTNIQHRDAKATKTSNGIIVVEGDSTFLPRAFSAFASGTANAVKYAEAVNEYKRILGDSVNVYCMPIPIASEYYAPDCVSDWCKTQANVLNALYSALSDSVQGVDAYTILGEHATEDIYSRTDHHWLPLGAYYAAKVFAQTARVPFKDIPLPIDTAANAAPRNKWYEQRIVHNFVGTMYKLTHNALIKNNPEEFVYWVPADNSYETYQVLYTLDGARKRVIRESEEKKTNFFRHFKDGNSNTYCTFMGGDYYVTHVKALGNNGRRLLILKDSFGNALPGYLFYSFNDVYVIDCRYFTKNICEYVRDNGITDILFANNIRHALTPATFNMYKKYLEQ